MSRRISIVLIFLFSAFMVFAQDSEQLYKCMCYEGAPCRVVAVINEEYSETSPCTETVIAETITGEDIYEESAYEEFAYESDPDDITEIAEADLDDLDDVEIYEELIPEGIRDNVFYLRSLHYTQLAHETFESGNYDASASFAREAIRYAERSDEFVAEQLIAEAKRLLDWSVSNNMETRFPDEYNEGKSYYEVSVIAHDNKEWNDASMSAIKSIEILSLLEANRTAPLPSQFTVRTWAGTRDCLWNIAGYPFVYGDPWKWRELYEANRARMPNPNNPNLIEPGFVLDIPSIGGEVRQGMWDPSRTYE